jgi:glutamate racemase
LSTAPIGVFDSGIGGFSVLKALCAELPHERFVYYADSAHAPYGERGDAYVLERSLAVSERLFGQHRAKALVVACNTATAAAIGALRTTYPHLPIVGIEPALKPAAQQSGTRRIGVMATRGTLASGRFQALRDACGAKAQFVCQPCDGLAEAIEKSAHDLQAMQLVETLCAQHLNAMQPFGPQEGQIDTLVLGCTHYPLVADILRRHLNDKVQLLEPGAPVARQARRMLEASPSSLAPCIHAANGAILLQTSGSMKSLAAAAQRWLPAHLNWCLTS